MALVRVTGTNFIRDTNTMALVNTDVKEKAEYQNKLQILKSQKEEINKVKAELSDIKQDMSEIKNILLKLMDKK